MISFLKIFIVIFLYCYLVFYLKYFELQPIFFIASFLFFLSIIISLKFKEHYFAVNIFSIVALVNLSIILAIYAYFEIGIIMFFILILILFVYCYALISSRKNIQDS
ncbi:hypothetical protein FOH38_22220 [Lysinibacillus fusiformis]|nr:hypothetical protein FOH38_22220 [Lysinibacillus fusiformis]